MKKIELTLSEFLNFRKVALQNKVKFLCTITAACTYIVEAPAKFLSQLGF